MEQDNESVSSLQRPKQATTTGPPAQVISLKFIEHKLCCFTFSTKNHYKESETNLPQSDQMEIDEQLIAEMPLPYHHSTRDPSHCVSAVNINYFKNNA